MADVDTVDASYVSYFKLSHYIHLSYSAVQIFHELLEEYKVSLIAELSRCRRLMTLQNRGVGLYITHLKQNTKARFAKAGIVDLLGHEAFQSNVADAMARVEAAAQFHE